MKRRHIPRILQPDGGEIVTVWIDHRRETVSDGTPYRCRKCKRASTGPGSLPVYVKYLAVPGWGCRHCGDYLKPEDLPCTLCGVEGGGHMAACLSLNPTAD